MERCPLSAVTLPMRASHRLAQLAVGAVALSAAGCAAGGQAPTSPHVAVSISAPTSGATVGVHKVSVIGTVSPAGAQVAVNGQPAKVTGSSFTTTLYVSTANEKIVASGAAHGYVGAQTTTTVSYSANVVQQLVAAAASVNNNASSLSTNNAATSVVARAFGLPSTVALRSTPAAGGKRSRSGSAGAPARPGNSSGATATSPGSTPPGSSGSGSPVSTSPSGSPPAPSAPTTTSPPTTTPPPAATPPVITPPVITPPTPVAPTPAQVAAVIHNSWVHGCIRVNGGGNVVPYCTCTYNHLAGALQTPASAEHVLRELGPYLHTGDVRKVPLFIQRAVQACVSKLPPLDPLTGKAVVSPLPGFQHGATAASSDPQSDPGSTPIATTPVTPTPVTPAPVTTAPVATLPNARSAMKSFYDTLVGLGPPSSAPAYAGAVGQANSRLPRTRLTPQSGHQKIGQARIVAQALGYTLLWIADHDRTGAYPYGYRVQRRLHHRLSAALKLAA